MLTDQIDQLACPFCDSSLDLVHGLEDDGGVVVHGIVECSCSQYPATHNIVNFGGKHRFRLASAVRHLQAGDVDQAIAAQLEMETLPQTLPGKAMRKLALAGVAGDLPVALWRRLTAPPINNIRSFAQGAKRLNDQGFGQYLVDRYALPSFHAALPVCTMLQAASPHSILDLGCGAGHYTTALKRLFPGAGYIGVDQFYANLLLGQLFLNPDRDLYVCTNLKHPPCVKSSFDLIFASDILYTLSVGEDAMMRYLEQTSDQGVVYIPRFDHCWDKSYVHPPANCPDLLPEMTRYIFDEDATIKTIHEDGGMTMQQGTEQNRELSGCRAYGALYTANPEAADWQVTDYHSLVARMFADLWRVSRWCHAESESDTRVRLKSNPNIAIANQAEWRQTIAPHLPNELSLPANCLSAEDAVDPHCAELPRLIRDFAVTLTPENYCTWTS